MAVDKDTAANLRRQYNLAENASYEDILAAMLDAGTTPVPTNTKPGTDEDDNTERAEAQAAEAVAHQEATSRPLMSRGKHTTDGEDQGEDDALNQEYVSASAFAAYQAEHEAIKKQLADAKAEKDRERREGLIRSWFSSGRIGRDEIDAVRRNLEKNEDTTRDLIDNRAPMFSAHETGHNLTTPDMFAASTAETITKKQYEADDAVFGTHK